MCDCGPAIGCEWSFPPRDQDAGRIVELLEKGYESSGVSKKMCDKCKMVHREGVVRVICTNPKHKQRQG